MSHEVLVVMEDVVFDESMSDLVNKQRANE
jgi:hypothetical protein